MVIQIERSKWTSCQTAGTKHKNVDGLSRIPWKDPLCECIPEDDSFLPCGLCKKCCKYNETMNLRVSRVTARTYDTADPH